MNNIHNCYCGGKMELEKIQKNGGMDGSYYNWKLRCKECGITIFYAADGFYGRDFFTEDEVINLWNKRFQ